MHFLACAVLISCCSFVRGSHSFSPSHAHAHYFLFVSQVLGRILCGQIGEEAGGGSQVSSIVGAFASFYTLLGLTLFCLVVRFSELAAFAALLLL